MTTRKLNRGRGRPKGSTSFVKIKASELIKHVGEEMSIVVSKKWLDDIGIEQKETFNPKVEFLHEVKEDEAKIEFTVS